MATVKIKTIEDYLNRFKESGKSELEASITAAREAYKKQADALKGIYDQSVSDTVADYGALERQNSVQELINERAIAEENANLGLTNSGYNATLKAAVRLSASNNAQKIEAQRTNAVNKLRNEMTLKLAELENETAASESELRYNYEKNAYDAAVKAYEADLEAQQKQAEAALKQEEENKKAEQAKNETADKARAEYTDLVYNVSKGNYHSDAVLAKLYDYVLRYDIEIDEQNFSNSDIEYILKRSRIPLSVWTEYYARRNGITVNNHSVAKNNKIELPVMLSAYQARKLGELPYMGKSSTVKVY